MKTKSEVSAHVAAVLTPAGFRKRGSVFERVRGDVTQLVEVQPSRDGVTVYVNVGLVIDALTALAASSTGALVVGKRAVHFGDRIDDALGNGLSRELERLDRIDGPTSALAVLDLERGFHKLLRAQLKWVTGDRDGALVDVKAVAAEFSDRRGCTVDELLTRSGLR